MMDTMGLPKAPKGYGSRGIVVLGSLSPVKHKIEERLGRVPGSNVRFLTTTAESFSTVATDGVAKIRKIAELCKANPEFIVKDKLYRLLYDKNLYLIAYNKLKSNRGTPGIVPTTLDGMSMEVIEGIISKLRLGSFDFQRKMPKANGKQRPLTIAPPRDKLVQECMRMILEAIFEPSFSECSHGFRPNHPEGGCNRSCHTALRSINQKFGMATWLIEGDISNCFPSISHNLLLNILKARIKDERFIDLIRKSLKAGYFEFKKFSHSVAGTPQGSIISPILANIFLDKLDKFVLNLKSEFDVGTKASINPEYKRLDSRKNRAKCLSMKIELHKQMLKTIDPNFKKLEYIRYADD